MRLMKALDSKAEFKPERLGISSMFQGDAPVNNADPFDTKRDAGEIWVEEGPHLMLVLPDPKMLEGFSDDPSNGGPYLMWRGTPYAHLMVPAPHGRKKRSSSLSRDAYSTAPAILRGRGGGNATPPPGAQQILHLLFLRDHQLMLLFSPCKRKCGFRLVLISDGLPHSWDKSVAHLFTVSAIGRVSPQVPLLSQPS